MSVPPGGLLLDTTVLIDALRGDESLRERIARLASPPFVSAISVEELYFGMRSGEEDRTRELVEGMVVADVGPAEALLSGSWRRAMRRTGVTLSQADALIAACAWIRGLTLATANVRDFPLSALRVEHWPPDRRPRPRRRR